VGKGSLAADKEWERIMIVAAGGEQCGVQDWVATGTNIPVRSPVLTDIEQAVTAVGMGSGVLDRPLQLENAELDLYLKAMGIYSITCKCGKVCTGKTRHFIETRINENLQHIWLCHLEKLATAEH